MSIVNSRNFSSSLFSGGSIVRRDCSDEAKLNESYVFHPKTTAREVSASALLWYDDDGFDKNDPRQCVL